MPPGAPTCTGFQSVLPAVNIPLSQVLQSQVSVLGGAPLHLTSHIKGAQVAAWWCLPLAPPSACTPHYTDVQTCSTMKGEQSLPFLLASHLSDSTWGLQSVPPGTKQATQMREATWAGRGVSWRRHGNLQHVLSSASCYQEGTWGWKCQILQFFKEKIEI